MYQRRVKTIEAEQFTNAGKPPRLCSIDNSGCCFIRVSDVSHDRVRLRDYVVYPSTECDEDGELSYPEVWHREQFERTFEEVG